jgi:rod shape-determining protein MreC
MRRLTRRQRAAALVLAVLAAGFVALDVGGSSLDSAHAGARGVLGSLYRGTDGVLGPLRRFAQAVPHAGADDARIRSLQHDNAELRRQLADARTDRHTAAELSRLRLAAHTVGHRVLPGRVVALSPAQGFDWTVTIDTGTAAGVAVGQTVTDGFGLVGRVLHADRGTAVVLLAVDPGSGVGARDLRTGDLGVATGSGPDGFSFRPLDPKARLRVGDRISTGPAGSSSFVPGLAVGTVRAVHASTDGSTLATLAPTVAVTTLDLVGIIVDRGRTTSSRAALRPGPGR